jgi:hypothetical protein
MLADALTAQPAMDVDGQFRFAVKSPKGEEVREKERPACTDL